jgi:SAM-dependent methyltransferase
MNVLAKKVSDILALRHHQFVAKGNPFRERRVRFFVDHLIESPADSVLNVGYGYGQFESYLAHACVENRIIALDRTARDVKGQENVAAFVVADATSLPFADGSIDVVFSNSVIEHVGERERQQRMFDEIERVGKRFLIQTPNAHFPVEAHHLLPFFQYLPTWMQRWVGRNLLGHYEKVWLLSGRDIEHLTASHREVRVVREHFMGVFTKSYYICRFSH